MLRRFKRRRTLPRSGHASWPLTCESGPTGSRQVTAAMHERRRHGTGDQSESHREPNPAQAALPCPTMPDGFGPSQEARPIRIAFSPDSDDLFMFWALLAGKVDAEGLSFEPERADTEALNELAAAGQADVVAVSIARWPSIAHRYLLLPHGMSVGRGYGPALVAQRACDLGSLRGARIGVPGLRTTAYLVLRLLLPRFEPVVLPIAPYARVFEALRAGEVQAALLIHEGRLTFEREGLHCVCDIGHGWSEATKGLPLPLGANAIRRTLGTETIAQVSRILRRSIAWALSNREETMRALLERESRAGLHLDKTLLDRYLAMYANADTLDAPSDVRRAIELLYARASAAGLLDSVPSVDFAP